MGLLDNAQNLLNRGVAATERGTRTISLKTQLGDAKRQRDKALIALGESAYANETLRGAYEEQFKAVENADAQIADIEKKIAEVEAQGQAARDEAAAQKAASSHAGPVGEETPDAQTDDMAKDAEAAKDDEKGAAAEEAAAAVSGSEAHCCPVCGAAIAGDYKFCPACGGALAQ